MQNTMEIWLKITINFICSQFALIMLVKIANKKEKHLNDYKLFKIMLITICVLLLAHSLALFTNGTIEGTKHIILGICMFILFPTTAFMTMIYAIYIEIITSKITRHTKYYISLYSIPFILSVGLNTASEYTGWFFFFDDNGCIQKGPYLAVPIIISFSYIFAAMLTVVKRRKQLNRSEFFNLLSIPLPMFIAGTIQSYVQEIPILLPGCVLSLFLIFSIIQERRLSFDHLTGAYNRQKLDEFLEIMIENTSSTGKKFSALLADVNKFKSINDTYGHTEGDKALIAVVDTIKSEIRNNDFLARYAGDEFVVLFPNCKEAELANIIDRIHQKFALRTSLENKYPLSISIGADSFRTGVDIDAEQFIKRLDALMYQNKKEFHKK